MQFQERIQKYEYKLNDTDDQIIEYIINHKQEITNISIQTLASRLYTVPNTIYAYPKNLAMMAFPTWKTV